MTEPDPKKAIEEQYELPEGWMWTALSEICKPKITKDPKNNGPGEFIYLDIESIDNEIQTIVNPRRLKNKKAPSRAKRLVNSGDVIISLVRPYLKNIALIPEDLDNSIASTAFYPLKPERGIDSHYLFHTVCRQSFIDSIVTYGDSPPSARDGEFIKIQIPLPPLPEQHRIVTKLEALLAQVNRSKDHLAKAPPLIKRFRQSVLAAACSGRLTEDWRREYPDVKPASELLNRIREERVRRYEEECRKAEAEGRRKPKKPKNVEPQEVDTEGLPELPEGWAWTKLGDVNETTSGGTPKRSNKDYYGGDIPWLKSGELEDNVITKAEETITELGLKKSSAKIFPTGTLLIALYGATVGKTGKLAIESATNQAICGIFNDDLVFYDRYLWHYLISFRNILIEKSFGGAQPNISQGIIQNLNVPLPSLSEQRVIVEQVQTLFHFADEVEQRVTAATTHANHLTQSILARAFRGELVPQDPRDEPAGVLLERIKQERAELKAKKKTQKRESKTMLDFN